MNNNEISALRRWLGTVNFRSADVQSVEQQIYVALHRSHRKKRWSSQNIAPFSEVIDLDALVGELLNGAHEEIRFQASRVDTVYNLLNSANNEIKARLETVEKLTTEASSTIQDLFLVEGSGNSDFVWISDSFNSSVFTDPNSTIQVDSDYGAVTLQPETMEVLGNYTFALDKEVTKGLPGCNLLVLDSSFSGSSEKEPTAVLEALDTRSFANVFDGDPTTWFEIERNFISPKQRVTLNGRAWKTSEVGKEEDVLKITNSLDWKAYVQWGEGAEVDQGLDGGGIYLAEFVDLGKELQGPTDPKKYAARLAFEITLLEPQPISILKISPLKRETQTEGIQVESIRVLADGEWIDVAADIELGTNKSTTRLQRDLLRRTGFQEVGSLFSIPTDRNIQSIRIVLYSNPEIAPRGLGHIFRDFLHQHRSERNHGLWRSVDKWKEWARDPINKTPPTLVSLFNPQTKLSGAAVVQGLQTGTAVGQVTTKGTQPSRITATDYLTGQAAIKTVSAGAKALSGMAFGATWLAKAVPVLGATIFLGDLVGKLFSYSHSDEIIDGRQGYDIFRGWRAGIGIRELDLMRMTYKSEGTFYSKKRSFSKPVSRIGLFVDEGIPEGWEPGDWLSYYISLDGTTWVPLPKLTETTLERAYVPPSPVTDVYFRCDIKGNPRDVFRSPALYHYTLSGLP